MQRKVGGARWKKSLGAVGTVFKEPRAWQPELNGSYKHVFRATITEPTTVDQRSTHWVDSGWFNHRAVHVEMAVTRIRRFNISHLLEN